MREQPVTLRIAGGRTWADELRAADRAVFDAHARRREVVTEALSHGIGPTAIARVLGVTRQTINRWTSYQQVDQDALLDQLYNKET